MVAVSEKSMNLNRITSICAAACLLLLATPARAGELDVSLGFDGSASEWDENIAGPSLGVGWAFYPWLQVDFISRTSYAQVDERILTYLSLGIEAHHTIGPVRPLLRAGVVHQHEEPIAAVEDQPFQALLGVGDGIRHRAGLDLTAGLEVPLYQLDRGDLYSAVQVGAAWFPDPRGPSWYAAAGLAVGLRWDFSKEPASNTTVARAP